MTANLRPASRALTPRLLGLSLALAATSACGTPAAPLAKPPEFAPKGETKCGVTKSQTEPLIVEWPDAERGKLEALVRKQVIAVRYQGCEMEVLGRCRAPGGYGYTPITLKQSHVRMRDADDLYASIPVHAAQFEGKLQKSGELQVDMTIVGRFDSDGPATSADQLTGECAGATHLITGITVGAFDFFAGAEAAVSAGGSVAGVAKVGGGSEATRETLNQDGDKVKCGAATTGDKRPPDGCGALLRLEVVALRPSALATPGATAGGPAVGAAATGHPAGPGLAAPPLANAVPTGAGLAAGGLAALGPPLSAGGASVAPAGPKWSDSLINPTALVGSWKTYDAKNHLHPTLTFRADGVFSYFADEDPRLRTGAYTVEGKVVHLVFQTTAGKPDRSTLDRTLNALSASVLDWSGDGERSLWGRAPGDARPAARKR